MSLEVDLQDVYRGKMAEKYFLRLRGDMPLGFIENDMIPELPAAYQFLQMYAGLRYASKHDFEKDLAGFGIYLRENRVPRGNDLEVRKGLFLFEDGSVGTHNNSPSERCEFGRLEKEVLE